LLISFAQELHVFEDARLYVESVLANDFDVSALRVLERLTERFALQPGLVELSMLVAAEATADESPAQPMLAERYELGLALLAEGLERDVRSGRVRADVDCVALARRCIATCDGLLFDWVRSGRGFDVMNAVRKFIAETQ
jgi:hypothetical protein